MNKNGNEWKHKNLCKKIKVEIKNKIKKIKNKIKSLKK